MLVNPRSRAYAPAYKLLYEHVMACIRTRQINSIRHTEVDKYGYVIAHRSWPAAPPSKEQHPWHGDHS